MRRQAAQPRSKDHRRAAGESAILRSWLAGSERIDSTNVSGSNGRAQSSTISTDITYEHDGRKLVATGLEPGVRGDGTPRLAPDVVVIPLPLSRDRLAGASFR